MHFLVACLGLSIAWADDSDHGHAQMLRNSNAMLAESRWLPGQFEEMQLSSDPCDVSASFGPVGEWLDGVSYQWVPSALVGIVALLMVTGPAVLRAAISVVFGSLMAGTMLGSCIDFFLSRGQNYSLVDAVNSFLDARAQPVCYWVAGVWVLLGVLRPLASLCWRDTPRSAPPGSAGAKREQRNSALLQEPLLNATAAHLNRRPQSEEARRTMMQPEPKRTTKQLEPYREVTRPQAARPRNAGADSADAAACGCGPIGRSGQTAGRSMNLPRPAPSQSTGVLAQMKRKVSALKDEISAGYKEHHDARPGGARAGESYV